MSTVLVPRIVVVSPDQELGQQLATGLQISGAAVDVHQTIDTAGELQAALWVVHGVARELLPRLTGAVIAVLPRADLAAVVDLMQSSERVAGVIVAEGLDPRELTAMA